MLKKTSFFILLFLLAQTVLHAQKGTVTLSGFIADKSDGEKLPGATILVKSLH